MAWACALDLKPWGPQWLSERLYHRAGRFPGAVCVAAAALPLCRRAAAGAAPARSPGARRCEPGGVFPGPSRSGAAPPLRAYTFFILAVKHCSAASGFPRSLSFPLTFWAPCSRHLPEMLMVVSLRPVEMTIWFCFVLFLKRSCIWPDLFEDLGYRITSCLVSFMVHSLGK